jgi:hypothetical protein
MANIDETSFNCLVNLRRADTYTEIKGISIKRTLCGQYKQAYWEDAKPVPYKNPVSKASKSRTRLLAMFPFSHKMVVLH